MPPKVKVTKNSILDAAYEIARCSGIDSVNARTVSQRLHCSTQPVMYNFATIDELKRAVYQKADEEHSRRLLDIRGRYPNPMMEIGMNYVRFAAEEPALFKLLFQTDAFENQSFEQLLEAEELRPVLEHFAAVAGADIGQAKKAFAIRFLLVHGIASMLANNTMKFDEAYVLSLLMTMPENG